MDDIYYKIPNILNLSGITLEDYIPLEDVADDRLLAEDDEVNVSHIYPYNSIPQIFTSINKWPESTNLCCWSCGFKFDTIPIFIPTYIRETNDSVEIGVKGNMCSFNCAELWIESTNISREERHKLQTNLCFLYYIITGKRISYIKPSPCKTNLLQYGGTWNEETFLKHMRNINPLLNNNY
jgi:hypothetical protein